MKAFFRKLGAVLSGVRTWTVNLLTLVLVVYIVVVVAAVMGERPVRVEPAGKVLILNPEGVVLDQEIYPAKLSFPPQLPEQAQIQSRDLIRLIRAAAADERLAAVLIDFSKLAYAGPSTVLNIAHELAALSRSGKPVIAFSETLSTTSYLMAAQADEIYVHPAGAVGISGIGGYRDYIRDLTEKLKINIHNYSQGDYKSYVEGLTRNDMSDADRRQREELYGPIWQTMKDRMAAARGIDADVFQLIADDYPAGLLGEAAFDNLLFAQQQGIIDGTKGFPEFRAYMIERFGKDPDSERETYPHIGGDAYLAQLEEPVSTATEAVAVVFVEGAIQPGEQRPGVAGSDDIANLIRTAHEADSTRALVLRVNSPGGSIIASDIIRDELVAARNKDLPIFVSMGDVAASGGVWVSTPADKIYAEPTTVTGSIGVAIAFPTLENLFDYVGIHFDGVTTSEFQGWGINQAVGEKLDAVFARFASSAYQRFISNVAQDRGRDEDYIRSIAGGRVWLADRAQELGLIDELGTLEDTVAAAAAAAGLSDYHVNYVVKEPGLAMLLLQRFALDIGIESNSIESEFAQRMRVLLETIEDYGQPRATVMCAHCMIEMR